MNKEWSELNKTMQTQIKKKDTYETGIDTLFSLRNQLMQILVSFKEELHREDFNAIPYINADGYHSKTIAYSIWHIFRIEDIVAHTLINEDEQVSYKISEEDIKWIKQKRSPEAFKRGLVIPGSLKQKRIKGGVILYEKDYVMR